MSVGASQKKVVENLVSSKSSVLSQEFFDVRFVRCDMSEAEYKACVFVSCEFVECNLSLISFVNTKFSECKFKNCKIIGVDWSVIRKGLCTQMDFENCDLSFSTYENLDISRSRFVKCKMQEVNFVECQMKKCIFNKSDLLKTRFIRNDLTAGDFTGAINFVFDIRENKCRDTKFSRTEAINLLLPFEVIVCDD